MARYTGPRVKKSRRAGVDLGHKQNLQKVARRISVLPGQHGRRGFRRLSEYGQQLLEKQKLRWTYGIMEKQFVRYVQEAQRNPQATGAELIRILEQRLDNILFRLGFVPTRAMGRQLVNHGHVRINGQAVGIPSYRVVPGDVITLSAKALEIPDVKKRISDASSQTPAWMQKKAAAGKILRLPERSDVDMSIDEQLIVEFYSR